MYSHATILKEILEKKSKYPIRRRSRNLPLNPPSLENSLLMIAEVKRASPSSGKLSEIPCAKELAKSYLDSGADVVSILCEKDYFQGELEDLLEVKETYPWACVLRKDFIVQTEQIQESYDFGADMVLLIVALFMEGQNGGFKQLKNLYEKALELGLTPLLEVHNKEEIDFLYPLSPKLVGINARNLHDFKINKIAAYALFFYAKKYLKGKIIFESSIQCSFDGFVASNIGFDGVLCGSYLVKSKDPSSNLKHLKQSMSFGKKSPNVFYANIFAMLQSSLGFLKICGICSKEDALMCAEILEKYLKQFSNLDKLAGLGFIFVEDSPRFIQEEVIREISNCLQKHPKILKVLVIKDDTKSMQTGIQLYQEGVIDALQLHGVRGEEFGGIFLKEANFPFYEVLNVQILSDFRSCISPFVLLDSKSALGGGSGKSINKEVLKALKQEVGDRLCVAGGVGRNNIQFLKELGAKMLDVNSSLESSPGKKDPQKVQEFLEAFTSNFRISI